MLRFWLSAGLVCHLGEAIESPIAGCAEYVPELGDARFMRPPDVAGSELTIPPSQRS
jgi:hypothetical protein